jgi:hypothetical protein
MWQIDDELVLEIDPVLTDEEALDRAITVCRTAVGEAALVDIHRIRANKMRVIIYVDQEKTRSA